MKPRFLFIAAFVMAALGALQGRLLAAFDLTTASIADIQAAVDAGELTYERLIQMHIDRIATYDKRGPALNDVIAVNARALAEARALDAEYKAKGRRSPLHGIPVAVKDIIDQEGMPNSGGTLALRNSFPSRDAFIIRKLREAGAIILVRTNLSEFASGAPGLDGVSTLGRPAAQPLQSRPPLRRLQLGDGRGAGGGFFHGGARDGDRILDARPGEPQQSGRLGADRGPRQPRWRHPQLHDARPRRPDGPARGRCRRHAQLQHWRGLQRPAHPPEHRADSRQALRIFSQR